MAETKRRSRSRRRRTGDAARISLLRIFRAEFAVYYLRGLRERRPARYAEWKAAAMSAVRAVFRSIETGPAIASTTPAGADCVEGESYVQSMTDAQGNTYTRTCTQYWCDTGDGHMEPDGESCGPWRPVDPTFRLASSSALDDGGTARLAPRSGKSEGSSRRDGRF